MTKARDLANASTALSAVSATELGYLDGVTSAVQTQIDSKPATASTVSTAGGSTITVASGTTVPLTIQNNGTGNSLVVNDVASDTTPFTIGADGRVGIGTTSLTAALQISDSSRVRFEVDTSTVKEISTNAAQNAYAVKLSDAASYTVNVGGTTRLGIDSNGATTVAYTTTSGGAVRNIYMSTSDPSGGSDGDVWIKYTA